MTTPNRYLPRELPPPIDGLSLLAVDLRWSWNHGADTLWETIDPELWKGTGDPWLILESVPRQRLEELATDKAFLMMLEEQLAARREYLEGGTWFGDHPRRDAVGTIAYFSMEFGLSEALPIYSGGLGILAGDHLKTASDLGVPMVGIGLLYQQGYFRQALDANGNQLDFHPYNNPAMLPVTPLRDAGGGWLRVAVELPGRSVHLRAWQAQIGRVSLYLLDSNDLLNGPGDRGITGELYGGGPELRLQQEIVLGIGGWRLLRALDLDCAVCHLNEGHAAFAVVERAADFAARHGVSFPVALRCTRAGNLFTTHTPVAAGFDCFTAERIATYFGAYAARIGISMGDLLALGRADSGDPRDESFNMAHLALRGSGACNGVSRLHGAVSRDLFQPLFPRWPTNEVPVGHVTNGVHVPSWDSAAADALWTEACGKDRWVGSLESLEADLRRVDDSRLWIFRSQGRQQLIISVRERLARQRAARAAPQREVDACGRLLDADILTLGFARRFATYKRPNLLLHDPARLTRLLGHPERPVQLIIAGKAHPRDEDGKRLVRAWAGYLRRPEVNGRVVFLEDYDMALATELVQGVDLWINTPLRPWEASGTSGMKVLVNGGLNLSELDGWWAEAYAPELGWALGDGREHNHDPAWDAVEADALYTLLEQQVVPEFYARDEHGVPNRWVARMRESMAHLTPQFSTNRMLREYIELYYLPAADGYRRRAANGGALGAELEAWQQRLRTHWDAVHVGPLEVAYAGDDHHFQVPVYLDDLNADDVRLELYADPVTDGAGPVCIPMTRAEPLTGAANGFLFTASAPASRPAGDYTPRLLPHHPAARIPLEAAQILWPR